MPVIHVYHHSSPPDVTASLTRLCRDGAQAIDVPLERIWALWHDAPRAAVCRPDWNRDEPRGPIVRVFCRRSHARDRVRALMHSLRETLSAELECAPTSVFIQVLRVDDEDVLNVD